MAIATATAIALALAAASAGTAYYNTQKTAAAQDRQASDAIRSQSQIQQKGDAAVNAEVEKLKTSRSEDERREGLDAYMQQLTTHKKQLESGLTPNFGSDTFKADSAQAVQETGDYASDTAGMMARMDAPQQQRQGEAFGFGKLATDLSLVGRESQGQDFIDQLRMRAIRRNPGLDALSAFLAGAAGSGIGSGAGAGNSAVVSKTLSGGTGYGTINTGAAMANLA